MFSTLKEKDRHHGGPVRWRKVLCQRFSNTRLCIGRPIAWSQQVMFSFSVRTFVTEFKLKKTFLNTTTEKHSDLREVENEITKTVSFPKGIFL